VTRFAVVTEAEEGWLCGTGSIRIRLNSPDVLTGYLRRYLQQDSIGEWLKHHSKGVTMQNLNTEVIRALPFVYPPLVEQRRIVKMMDRADALLGARHAALNELDSLTQSIFHQLFGDVAKNDKGWPTERMGNLITIRRGGSPRPIENYLGGDINWIKIGDATQGSDIYLECCRDKITSEGLKKTVFLEAGSLIFANCGVSLGFARILKIDGCIHDGWLSFENIPESKLDKLFLLKALNSITEYFRQIAPAGTQPNLNTSLMKNFRIILPPISLQREFAHRVMTVEKLKAAQRTSLAKMDELFASLQHRAFRGEL
jgi:type I restriction enzyme S subunit